MDATGFLNPDFTVNYPSNAFGVVGSNVEGGMDTDLRFHFPLSVELSDWIFVVTRVRAVLKLFRQQGKLSKPLAPQRSSNKEVDMGTTMDHDLRLGSTSKGGVQYPFKVDLPLSLSTGPSESDFTNVHADSPLDARLEIPPFVGGSSGTMAVHPSHGSVHQISNSILPDPYSSTITILNST